MEESPFEALVSENWSRAVMRASHELTLFRQSVLAGLGSPNPEVRSAAVATLYEANDSDAHDAIVALLDDVDDHVRHEVLEYLSEYARPTDASALHDRIGRAGYGLLHLTKALNVIVSSPDGLLYGEEPQEQVRLAATHWKQILSVRGLLSA